MINSGNRDEMVREAYPIADLQIFSHGGVFLGAQRLLMAGISRLHGGCLLIRMTFRAGAV